MKILKKLKYVLIALVLFFVIGFASDYFRDVKSSTNAKKPFWGKKEYYTDCVAGARIHCIKRYIFWTEVWSNGCPTEQC